MDADLFNKMLQAQLDQSIRQMLGLLDKSPVTTATDQSTGVLTAEHFQAILEKLRAPKRHFIIHGTQGEDGLWRPTFAGTVQMFNILVSQQAPAWPQLVRGIPETSLTDTFEAEGAIWHMTPHIKPGECYELKPSQGDFINNRLPPKLENIR